MGLFIAGQAYLPFLPQSPVVLISALTYDPDTYFDLGDGLHGPYDICWLGDFDPKVGLSEKELCSLEFYEPDIFLDGIPNEINVPVDPVAATHTLIVRLPYRGSPRSR